MSLSNRQWKTKHALTHRENELLNVGSNQRIKCTGKKATSVNSARFMHKRKSNDDTCYVCPEIGGSELCVCSMNDVAQKLINPISQINFSLGSKYFPIQLFQH